MMRTFLAHIIVVIAHFLLSFFVLALVTYMIAWTLAFVLTLTGILSLSSTPIIVTAIVTGGAMSLGVTLAAIETEEYRHWINTLKTWRRNNDY